LLAVIDDLVVGHCLVTRAQVGGAPVLALGPIGVIEERQRQGIGTALMGSMIDIAEERGEDLIGLVGDEGFYERFGFVLGSSIGIEPADPAWGDHFQVRMLKRGGAIEGVFEYPSPFMTFE
jgi:putative acetyltransferase